MIDLFSLKDERESVVLASFHLRETEHGELS